MGTFVVGSQNVDAGRALPPGGGAPVLGQFSIHASMFISCSCVLIAGIKPTYSPEVTALLPTTPTRGFHSEIADSSSNCLRNFFICGPCAQKYEAPAVKGIEPRSYDPRRPPTVGSLSNTTTSHLKWSLSDLAHIAPATPAHRTPALQTLTCEQAHSPIHECTHMHARMHVYIQNRYICCISI
jgi:hypothetical protein